MIQYKGVTGLSKKFHIEDVSFSLNNGFMLGLLGKNGAGKTTLLRYMLNESIAYKGEIIFERKEIRENRKAFLQEVGYISEDQNFLMEYSVLENGWVLGHLYEKWNDDIFQEQLKAMEIPNRKLCELSRGEYMKFQMAFAMAHQAKLFLVDEATAGMDIIFRKEFYGILRKCVGTNRMAIVTSHIENDIMKHMDYIGVMEDGKLISYHENLQ